MFSVDEVAIRNEAWDMAVHAEGTRYVFEKRARAIKRRTELRDYIGLSIPVISAYFLTAEHYPLLDLYKGYALVLLGIFSALQALFVIASFVRRWDEKLALDVRAARDNYELTEGWKKLGKLSSETFRSDYENLSNRQSLIDSHLSEMGVTEREKTLGLRAGLRALQRKCICTEIPRRIRPPLWGGRCHVCGGN